MEKQTQTSNYLINDVIEEKCKKIFYQQKIDILSNLRIYARHDNEIQFFLDKIINEVRKELDKEKREMINELQEIKDKVIDKTVKQLEKNTENIIKEKNVFDKLVVRLSEKVKMEYKGNIEMIYFLICLLFGFTIYLFLK